MLGRVSCPAESPSGRYGARVVVWWFVLDALLALGACLRLTRFVVADDVPGTWWIRWPLDVAKHRYMQAHEATHESRMQIPSTGPHGEIVMVDGPTATITTQQHPWWGRYLEGLECPFCVSVWMAAAVVGLLALAGGPGHAEEWWRYPAGFLALAWLTGHLAAWSGDVTEDST